VLDITLRDGMVIVGSLLILAVAVDAWRRMRQQQRSRVRVKLASDIPDDDVVVDDLTLYRELPNGGARVVPRNDARAGSFSADEGSSGDADAGDAAATATVPRAPSSPQSGGKPLATAKSDAKGSAGSEAKSDAKGGRGTRAGGSAAGDAKDSGKDPSGNGMVSKADESDDDVSPLAGVRARDDEEPANLDWLEDLPETSDGRDDQGAELPRSVETEVIVLHVTARDDRGFAGQDILEILLACDLRFGDMNFFHRHEQKAGRGPIQFSVANMLQPGVFDIDNMGSMTTRGLVFFLTLPGPEDMILAFDCMLETARTVARNLGGELLDESRSVLTQQAVEHSRQQIRELDRRLRARQN
jgi:cell division protein ZipA